MNIFTDIGGRCYIKKIDVKPPPLKYPILKKEEPEKRFYIKYKIENKMIMGMTWIYKYGMTWSSKFTRIS